jgi:enoyl-CoA hydratase/carnithine racemase
MTDFVQTQIANRLGIITLNRAQALNALNLDMVRALQNTLSNWATDPHILAVVLTSSSGKALCAGGDIRFFHTAATTGDEHIEDFFTEEYALNHCIANYPKPYIALMQGVVMGGGMGVSTVANPATGLRVVTDTSKLAMPEVNIGLFPDVGGTHFLSHLKNDPNGTLGAYLALTATPMNAANAIDAGLADAYCPASELPNLLVALQQSSLDTREAVRDAALQFCASFSAGESSFTADRAVIDTVFSHATAPDMCRALGALGTPFAQAALKAIYRASPLLIHISLKALRHSKSLTLAQSLRMERGLMRRCFAHGEPVEGIRALAVDKDHAPKWAHTDVTQVSAAEVNAFFEPVWRDSEHPLRHL